MTWVGLGKLTFLVSGDWRSPGHYFNFCCDPSGRIFRFWVANFSRVTRQKRERECSENGHGSLTNIKVANTFTHQNWRNNNYLCLCRL